MGLCTVRIWWMWTSRFYIFHWNFWCWRKKEVSFWLGHVIRGRTEPRLAHFKHCGTLLSFIPGSHSASGRKTRISLCIFDTTTEDLKISHYSGQAVVQSTICDCRRPIELTRQWEPSELLPLLFWGSQDLLSLRFLEDYLHSGTIGSIHLANFTDRVWLEKPRYPFFTKPFGYISLME